MLGDVGELDGSTFRRQWCARALAPLPPPLVGGSDASLGVVRRFIQRLLRELGQRFGQLTVYSQSVPPGPVTRTRTDVAVPGGSAMTTDPVPWLMSSPM